SSSPSLVVSVLNAEHVVNELRVVIEGPMGTLTYEGRASVTLSGVVRGVYRVSVYWRSHLIASRAVAVNVENVVETIELPFFDFALRVVDLSGAELPGPFAVRVEPPDALGEVRVVGSSIVLRNALRTLHYTISVEWESRVYNRKAFGVGAGSGDDLSRRGAVVLPVGDVRVSVIDRRGKGLGGAVLRAMGVSSATDEGGAVVLRRVPLEGPEGPNSLPVTVTYEGYEVASEVLLLSREVRSFTVTASVYELTVSVLGANGQPLQGAKASLVREGHEVGTAFADQGGVARLSRVIPVKHFLRVEYKGLSEVRELSPEAVRRGSVELRLPVYLEIGGIPLTFEQLVGLAAGSVGSVVAVVLGIALFVRSRTRKLRVAGPIY
ncbi:MAG: hypothetical protein NZ733_03730, partial [Aigarchaeota archaeon]|nr:hypothetical protein [Aigarchaeota archaeon]